MLPFKSFHRDIHRIGWKNLRSVQGIQLWDYVTVMALYTLYINKLENIC